MTARHDKATEGRTGAAAVDQAIADVRTIYVHPDEQYLSIRPETERGDTILRMPEGQWDREQVKKFVAALRVLADAVAEHGADPTPDRADDRRWIQDWRDGMFSSSSRDAEGWPIEMHGVVSSWEAEMARAEAAEAERDRLQVALDNGDRLLSQCGRETDRLARQVADLEAALREIMDVRWLPANGVTERGEIRSIARAALAAARSRDPQEPQT